MEYGGKDPVTGVWRELKTTEYRYKMPWNGVVWWTIADANHPMPPEYKSTLSDPYGVYSSLVDAEVIRPHVTITPLAPRSETLRTTTVVPSRIATAQQAIQVQAAAVAQEIQMRVPWQGVAVVGAVVGAGLLYRARGWIMKKLSKVTFTRKKHRR